MNRNLKALGLALLAVFATTAVLASAAQAQLAKVTVSPSPAWLTAEVIEHPNIGRVETFKLESGQPIWCEDSSTATVKNGDTSITVVPTFDKCTAVIGTEDHFVTFTMNDCDFLWHGGETASPGSSTFIKGQVDLLCPTGKEVEVHLYKSPTTETEELCTYKIAPFVNKGNNEFHNVGTGSTNDVTITHTVTGITITRTGSLLCGAASQNLTFTGSTTIKAFEDKAGSISGGTVSGLSEGNQSSVTISD